jgi:hypothetical protein
MDILQNMPTDTNEVSPDDQYLIHMISSKIIPSQQQVQENYDPTDDCKPSFFTEFKLSIFTAILAFLIYSPLLDEILKSSVQITNTPMVMILVKTLIFVIIHYLLVKNFLG